MDTVALPGNTRRNTMNSLLYEDQNMRAIRMSLDMELTMHMAYAKHSPRGDGPKPELAEL